MHPRLSRSTLGILLALAGILTQARAQTVVLHLRNGDRVSGNIIKEETHQVTLKTEWAAAVVVPIADIKSRESIPIVARSATNAPVLPMANAPSPGTAAITTPTPIPAKKTKHWAGEAQMGIDLLFSERNRQLYSGRLKATYTYSRLKNFLDYQFTYGQTEGELSDNRMFGSMKVDYDLTRRFYFYHQGGAGYDEIRRVDLRYELGPGVGYHIFKRTNFVFNVEFGAAYQTEFRADDTRSEILFYRIAEDATWKITPRMSLDEKFEFFPRVENGRQYRFRFESNFRLLLVKNLSFVVTVLDQYDGVPAEGVPQNDLQVRSAIGVKF